MKMVNSLLEQMRHHIYEKANEITQRIMMRSEFNQYNLLHALVQQRYLDRNVLSQQAR